LFLSLCVGVLLLTGACGNKNDKDTGNNTVLDSDVPEADTSVLDSDPVFDVAFETDTSDAPFRLPDPKTCEEAAANKSYVGCDFFPTVVETACGRPSTSQPSWPTPADTEAKVRRQRTRRLPQEAVVAPTPWSRSTSRGSRS